MRCRKRSTGSNAGEISRNIQRKSCDIVIRYVEREYQIQKLSDLRETERDAICSRFKTPRSVKKKRQSRRHVNCYEPKTTTKVPLRTAAIYSMGTTALSGWRSKTATLDEEVKAAWIDFSQASAVTPGHKATVRVLPLQITEMVSSAMATFKGLGTETENKSFFRGLNPLCSSLLLMKS
jgi:hypothetical protein